MGWNTGYTILEKQVVNLYDLDVLNKEVLEGLVEPFKNSDIDSGGSEDLRTKDGKSMEDVVCSIMEPEEYEKAIKNFIPDPEEPRWNEDLYNLYEKISKEQWNFY